MSIKTAEQLKSYVRHACEKAREDVATFSTNLQSGENPAHHAEWSGGFFAAAATLQILAGYEEAFRRIDGGEPGRITDPDVLMGMVKRRVLDDLIHKSSYAANQSTSPTYNLLELHKAQVLGKLAECLGLKDY